MVTKDYFVNMIRILFSLLFAFFIGFICWHVNIVHYGIIQLIGQIELISNTETVGDYLEKIPIHQQKVDLVNQVLEFAKEELGFQVNETYQKVYNQNNQPVLWVLSACLPYELEAYEWKFPLAGSFPYKGYFNKKRAEKEKSKLEKLGYEVSIGEVNAWSTLGWFNDPILSSMLDRSEDMLVRLILHELTHTNVYLKNEVEWNENIATFIGNEATKLFLSNKYGKDSEQLKHYNEKLESIKKYANWVNEKRNELDKLYQSIGHLELYEKRFVKESFFKSLEQAFSQEQFGNYITEKIVKRFREGNMNNNYLITFKTYTEQLEMMEKNYQNKYSGELKSMIADVLSNKDSLNK